LCAYGEQQRAPQKRLAGNRGPEPDHRIIQDEQPVGVALSQLLTASTTWALSCSFVWKIEQGSESEIGGGEVLKGVGLRPEHGLGNLLGGDKHTQGQLRFPNAARATDACGLREARVDLCEGVVQLGE